MGSDCLRMEGYAQIVGHFADAQGKRNVPAIVDSDFSTSISSWWILLKRTFWCPSSGFRWNRDELMMMSATLAETSPLIADCKLLTGNGDGFIKRSRATFRIVGDLLLHRFPPVFGIGSSSIPVVQPRMLAVIRFMTSGAFPVFLMTNTRLNPSASAILPKLNTSSSVDICGAFWAAIEVANRSETASNMFLIFSMPLWVSKPILPLLGWLKQSFHFCRCYRQRLSLQTDPDDLRIECNLHLTCLTGSDRLFGPFRSCTTARSYDSCHDERHSAIVLDDENMRNFSSWFLYYSGNHALHFLLKW